VVVGDTLDVVVSGSVVVGDSLVVVVSGSVVVGDSLVVVVSGTVVVVVDDVEPGCVVVDVDVVDG
jgi:hypothetical protein